tara:strand:- start:1105 stop:2394 length:1290 start_codon:yes stop_codon:yes gene_type:complete
MASERMFNLTSASALFKIKYEKLSENVYNSANVLLGRVKKTYNFTGKELAISIPQSFSGGVGSGTLPKANTAIYGDARITAKKMYAVVEIDRESIKAALSDEGAFVRATKEVVQKGVESFMRNLSRALFNDGTGKLGTSLEVASSDAKAATLAADSDGNIVIPIQDFKEANFEERDLVDIVTSASAASGAVTLSQKEIVAVDLDEANVGDPAHNPTVSIKGVSTTNFEDGSGNLKSAEIFMQGSKDKDPQGLKLLDKSSGSSYGITHGRRWKSVQKAAGGSAISTDMLNEVMLKVKKSSGKSPNLIVCSFKQYEKILNLLEDQKRYTVQTRSGLKSKSGADISFSGVEFMSVDGPVGIFPERFVEDDRIYLLNDNQIHIHHRPDFGWFDDDGTVFLRKADSDAYEARYGGYLECYINPCFHAVISGLSV